MSTIEQVARDAAAPALPHFVTNQWKYGWDDPHIPDADELAATVHHLVATVLVGPAVGAETGRFAARRAGSSIEVWLRLPGERVHCGTLEEVLA